MWAHAGPRPARPLGSARTCELVHARAPGQVSGVYERATSLLSPAPAPAASTVPDTTRFPLKAAP